MGCQAQITREDVQEAIQHWNGEKAMHLVHLSSTMFLKAAGNTLLKELSALLRAGCLAKHFALMSFREAIQSRAFRLLRD